MTAPWLSLVIPVFNEQANLRELIRRCLVVCDGLAKPFEIILVDDGSHDASATIITEAARENQSRVIGVLLNRNYGQHAAVMAGLAESRGEVVVTLDADLQNPPEEIHKLLAPIEAGCDVVGSIRINRRDSLFRRLSSRLINKVVQQVTGVMMHDYGCMLRAYRRPIVDAMLQCHERSIFISVLANSFAGKTDEVEVAHAERANGESKYNLWKLIDLLFDLLTSMTTFPLRVLSILGAVISLTGFLFSFLLLAMRLFFGAAWAAEGVFTIFAVLFVFVGVQLLAIGLIGEYVGRIYNDVRARPRYFIKKRVGSDLEYDPPTGENILKPVINEWT
jgi:undecaprenyl-phosphate 4-deoxy-4-formamido-L-arabinose transferase